MIVVLTPNPAVDETWHTAQLRPGTSHRVPTGTSRAGGKGLNVARILHGQGHEVMAIATVGGDTGAVFAAELDDSGIPHRLVPVAGATRRSIAVVDESTGEPTLFNEIGAPLAADEADALCAAVLADAERGDARPGVVAVCGSLPPGFDPDRLCTLVAALHARGIRVIVDTSGPALRAAARAGASIVKPNRTELAEATGTADVLEGARKLRADGAGTVVVSLGEEGLVIVAPGVVARARLPEALRTGNPTGAGDAVVAALCADAVAGDREEPVSRLRALARRAVAWSAAAVLMPLAGELSPAHTELEESVQVQLDREETPCP